MTWRLDKLTRKQTQNCCVRFTRVGVGLTAAIGSSLMHAAMKPTDEGPPGT